MITVHSKIALQAVQGSAHNTRGAAGPAAAEAVPVAAGAPNSLLRLDGISKTFGSTSALKGLDVDIHKGEFVTVVGPSGCGKSTLFNIVAGLEEPDAGGVLTFDGRQQK